MADRPKPHPMDGIDERGRTVRTLPDGKVVRIKPAKPQPRWRKSGR